MLLHMHTHTYTCLHMQDLLQAPHNPGTNSTSPCPETPCRPFGEDVTEACLPLFPSFSKHPTCLSSPKVKIKTKEQNFPLSPQVSQTLGRSCKQNNSESGAQPGVVIRAPGRERMDTCVSGRCGGATLQPLSSSYGSPHSALATCSDQNSLGFCPWSRMPNAGHWLCGSP